MTKPRNQQMYRLQDQEFGICKWIRTEKVEWFWQLPYGEQLSSRNFSELGLRCVLTSLLEFAQLRVNIYHQIVDYFLKDCATVSKEVLCLNATRNAFYLVCTINYNIFN